jgi:hypothetical protein
LGTLSTGYSRNRGRVIDTEEKTVLLIAAIVLLVISIAGGVIIHPVLFVLALVALAMYFSGRRRGAAI